MELIATPERLIKTAYAVSVEAMDHMLDKSLQATNQPPLTATQRAIIETISAQAVARGIMIAQKCIRDGDDLSFLDSWNAETFTETCKLVWPTGTFVDFKSAARN